ncbi:MAG: alpha/beta hydrolase [Xanthomonadales bacterium]|nr:alpha/beta hydrolase [Xanthomonadales bacterium]
MSGTVNWEFSIQGKPNGRTLLFIHGWPDDPSLWDSQVAALAPDFRCVSVTLPNFGPTAVKPGGFDFPELVEQLANTIARASPDGPVGLVTHDWGAYIGYMLEKERPDLVDRMASLDIGGHLKPGGLKSSMMIMGYQWALIGGWLVGGILPPLGNLMSRGVGKVVRVPSRQRGNILSRYSYPYFYLWRNMLLPWRKSKLLGRYTPRCPVLYLWGKRKPLMFHSDRWLKIVEDSGGKAIGIDGAGHWLMETHAPEVTKHISDWFGGEAD